MNVYNLFSICCFLLRFLNVNFYERFLYLKLGREVFSNIEDTFVAVKGAGWLESYADALLL